MTVGLFVLAGVFGVADWAAVRERLFRLEYLLKPLTMLALIAAAARLDIASDVQPWVLAGLAFGLLGDIAIMLSPDEHGRVDARFLGGVAAFLAGHVCYLVAFARYGIDTTQVVAGALIALLVAAFALPGVLIRLRRIGGDELMSAVAVYALVLAAMAALAVGTASILTAIGGVAFLLSDTVLSRDRFVKQIPLAPLVIVVLYQVAQFLIVLGLRR